MRHDQVETLGDGAFMIREARPPRPLVVVNASRGPPRPVQLLGGFEIHTVVWFTVESVCLLDRRRFLELDLFVEGDVTGF